MCFGRAVVGRIVRRSMGRRRRSIIVGTAGAAGASGYGSLRLCPLLYRRCGDDRQFGGQGAACSAGGKRGAAAQAIGRSRGGLTTKIHAVCDGIGRLRAFQLSPGNVADITVAPQLVDAASVGQVFLADKGYDATPLRRRVAERGAKVVIPNNATRKRPYPFDAAAYRDRNVIERMFCRLKDWRRIATRYDRLAANFASTVALVAAITQWT